MNIYIYCFIRYIIRNANLNSNSLKKRVEVRAWSSNYALQCYVVAVITHPRLDVSLANLYL